MATCCNVGAQRATRTSSHAESFAVLAQYIAPYIEYGDIPALSHVVAGERVALFADRALYWPAGRTLFVADMHLGKTAAFRAGGIALPGGAILPAFGRFTGSAVRAWHEDDRIVAIAGDRLFAMPRQARSARL